MAKKDLRNKLRNISILSLIWLLGAVVDRLWFALDHSVPGWDIANHLTGSLNYWRGLQHPQWLNGDWWTSFLMLSSKIPPLTYISGAIAQQIFGTGADQAALVMLFYSAILLISVYGLGKTLFSAEVGLWAAAICQLLPSLYIYRQAFLLDYPLAAIVTLSFWCLTVWRFTGGWGSVLAFGITCGLALMAKQTAVFFLLTPIVWVASGLLRHRRWGRLGQLVVGLGASVLVFGPWYRTNWLIILTSGKRATVDAAVAEGQPGLDKLESWFVYWKQLPSQVSFLLLIVPIVCLLFYWGRVKFRKDNAVRVGTKGDADALKWLALYWVGAYFLSSLNINKDDRYVLPYLPEVAIFLAYGLTCGRSVWVNRTRYLTVGLAVLLMLVNVFPISGFGDRIAQVLSPNGQHHPDQGVELPHQQVIAKIIATEPYLRSTLGVLPSTGTINQHNFNYYGALQNFQVYGRQVGTKAKLIEQDRRSLEWFLTKTGDQGSVPDSQAAMTQGVETSPDFQLQQTWSLPGRSQLKLYHSQKPTVEVQRQNSKPSTITLSKVTVPERVPPGIPVPVTYEWSGAGEDLQSGLVLLTWLGSGENPQSWIHDHGMGMGTIQPTANLQGTFQVTERMAMLPPANIPTGAYTLVAKYLNRVSGKSYSIPVPPVTLTIDPQATAIKAPELDLVTQLRTQAALLPYGIKDIGQVFAEIGRINQYDPIQDYLVQAQLTLAHRLQSSSNRDWAYGLALANILKRHVKGAIASLEQVTQLDSQNPYAYAYLAFVQLYNWQPQAAQKSLAPALAKNPQLREIQALDGIAALMQGNLVKAWHQLSPSLNKAKS